MILWETNNNIGDITVGSGKTVIACDIKPTLPLRIALSGEEIQINFFEGPPFKFTKSVK